MRRKKIIDTDSFCATALNEIPDMVRLIDCNRVVLYENKAFLDRFGPSNATSCYKVPNATDECDNCLALECINTKSRKTAVINVRGRIYSICTSPVVFGGSVFALEIISDITFEYNLKDKLMETNARMVNDLEVARSLQLSILRNELPSIEGYEFSAKFLPCEALGGDMYDCFLMRDGRIFMYIADVSGHGVMPAMLTVYLRQEMFAQCKNPGISPSQVLSNMQTSFEELNISPSIYITIFAIALEPMTGKFVYSNAGHSVTPLHANNNKVTELFLPGSPICRWTKPERRKEKKGKLHKGDRLFLYTDGIDGVHVDAEVMSKLCDIIKDKSISKNDLLDKIINKFARKKEDDVTMLLCERN